MNIQWRAVDVEHEEPSDCSSTRAPSTVRSQLAPQAGHLAISAASQREQLRRQLRSRPCDGRALWRLGELELELGEAAAFAAFARELLGIDRRVWRSACKVLHQCLGRPQDAVNILQDVHRDDPCNAEACCYLARLIPGQAQHWYDKALAAEPQRLDALLAAADLHRRGERFSEAAKCYEAADVQSPLAPRQLYRLGTCLVQDGHVGHSQRGRQYLMQVLQGSDSSLHAHAAVTIALSHAMAQEHAEVLEFCRLAGLLPAPLVPRCRELAAYVKFARLLQGITHMRTGDVASAAETLQSCGSVSGGATGSNGGYGGSPRPDGAGAALEDHWAVDQKVQEALALAETLRGNHAAAEQFLASARALAVSAPALASVLVGRAYLQQVRGDLAGAENLLKQSLEADGDSPLALLRMGHVLLCKGQLDKATQFLQKCLQQGAVPKLVFGASQRGAAHLYLCAAFHWRGAHSAALQSPRAQGGGYGSPTSSTAVCESAMKHAEKHFREGYALQPDLQVALPAAARQGDRQGDAEAARMLSTGTPPRVGATMDLTVEQALVLLFYAGRCLLVQARRCPPPWPPPPRLSEGRLSLASPTKLAAASISSTAAPPVVGTASTAAPTSPGPSREASDPSLVGRSPMPPLGAGEAIVALRKWMRPDVVLGFKDLELGECISCGEFAVVHRGRLTRTGRDVVVKTLRQMACVDVEQAADELCAEIGVFAELRHPRLVSFVGACLEPGRVALVTELAPGGNLHHALHVRKRQLQRRERFNLALEMLEGVQYLHALSPPVAHLDLKSMNLVLDAAGNHLYICDFGLARAITPMPTPSAGAREQGVEDGGDKRPPSRGGSPRYMAPECYDTSLGVLTERADVWSSGCVLLELFGGALPFAECGNVQQILNCLLVQRRGPEVPASIEAPVRTVVEHTLAFDASERPAIAQVYLQLASLAASEGSGSGAEQAAPLLWVP